MHKNKLILPIFALIILAFIYQIVITGSATHNIKQFECIDTDDLNPLETGVTTGYKWTMFGYKPVTYQDKCIPFDKSSKNRVREYYCDEFLVYRKNIRCPEGTICSEGACR